MYIEQNREILNPPPVKIRQGEFFHWRQNKTRQDKATFSIKDKAKQDKAILLLKTRQSKATLYLKRERLGPAGMRAPSIEGIVWLVAATCLHGTPWTASSPLPRISDPSLWGYPQGWTERNLRTFGVRIFRETKWKKYNLICNLPTFTFSKNFWIIKTLIFT